MDKTSKPQRKRIAIAAGACALAGGALVIVGDRPRGDYPRGSPTVVELGGLAEGKLLTVEWQGLPIWVLRRTPADIAALAGHEGELLDPGSAFSQQPAACANRWRSLQPDIFVAVGVCTHLGCAPAFRPAGADGAGAFVCPCHTSRYDMAGRVFRVGPAGKNLAIPAYRLEQTTRLVIGELS